MSHATARVLWSRSGGTVSPSCACPAPLGLGEDHHRPPQRVSVPRNGQRVGAGGRDSVSPPSMPHGDAWGHMGTHEHQPSRHLSPLLPRSG